MGAEASTSTGSRPAPIRTDVLDTDRMEALRKRWPNASQENITRLWETFKHFDKDNSGRIDVGELQLVLAALGKTVDAKTIWQFMEEIDTEPPYGTIDIEEWIDWNLKTLEKKQGNDIYNTSFWEKQIADKFHSQAELDSVVLHDRQGLPHWTSEQDFQKRYSTGKLLGKGRFASVFLVTDNNNNKKMAMKEFAKKDTKRQKIYKIIKEAIYNRRVAHPHVCQMYDLIETEARVLIMLELLEGGELYKALYNDSGPSKHFTEVEVAKIIREMTSALHHMSEEHIIHCDLKPENVLCTADPMSSSDWDVKITDFGLSKPVVEKDKFKSFPGSPLYQSPELLQKKPYTYATDMWSLGIMMYELLLGENPWASAGNLSDLQHMVKSFRGFGAGKQGSSSAGTNIELALKKANISRKGQDLLSRLLHPDSTRRITASQVLSHAWITKVKIASAKRQLNNGNAIASLQTDLHQSSSLTDGAVSPQEASSSRLCCWGPVFAQEAEGTVIRSLANMVPSSPENISQELLKVCTEASAAGAAPADLSKVERLLQQGANPNYRSGAADGNDPLHHVAKLKGGNTKLLSLLLQHGADPNQQGWYHSTALHFAAKAGNKEAAQVLIEKGAELDPADVMECRPIHYAAAAGATACIELLLASGADPTLKSKEGKTPLDLAIQNRCDEAARVLRQYTPSPHGGREHKPDGGCGFKCF